MVREPDPPAGAVPVYPRESFLDGFPRTFVDDPAILRLRYCRGPNARYRFLLDQGQTGLSVALDLPTQCGYDPNDPMAKGPRSARSAYRSRISEMQIVLFDGIDLSKISTSFTINGTADHL